MVPAAVACGTCLLGGGGDCAFYMVRRRAGALLVAQGAVPDRVYFVRRGSVLVSSLAESGDEILCSVRGAGSLLGLELVRRQPTDYEAWALGEVELCAMEARSFAAWLGGLDSPAGAVLTLALAEGAERRAERVALAGPAHARVARFLVERARAGDRPLAVKQRVLARMLGLRAETVSRVLARLRSAGALAPGRGVRIADLSLLERFAADDR